MNHFILFNKASHQLLSARKYTVSYCIVDRAVSVSLVKVLVC